MTVRDQLQATPRVVIPSNRWSHDRGHQLVQRQAVGIGELPRLPTFPLGARWPNTARERKLEDKDLDSHQRSLVAQGNQRYTYYCQMFDFLASDAKRMKSASGQKQYAKWLMAGLETYFSRDSLIRWISLIFSVHRPRANDAMAV